MFLEVVWGWPKTLVGVVTEQHEGKYEMQAKGKGSRASKSLQISTWKGVGWENAVPPGREVIWHSSAYQAGPCYEQEEGVNKKAVRGQFTAKRTSGEIISLPFWLGKTPFPLHLTNQQFDILQPNSKISNKRGSNCCIVWDTGAVCRKTGKEDRRRQRRTCLFLPSQTDLDRIKYSRCSHLASSDPSIIALNSQAASAVCLCRGKGWEFHLDFLQPTTFFYINFQSFSATGSSAEAANSGEIRQTVPD